MFSRSVTQYLLPFCLSIMFLAGCNQSTSHKSSVGLIDMDLVLGKTGRLQVIESELMKKQNEIQSDLKMIEKALMAELQKKKSEMGEKLTPEQETVMQQEEMKASGFLQNKQREKQRDYNDFIQKQRDKYITGEINPIIQSICQEKGFYLVILKGQAIVHDKTIDISEDVISRMQTISAPTAPDASASNPDVPVFTPRSETPAKSSTPLPSGEFMPPAADTPSEKPADNKPAPTADKKTEPAAATDNKPADKPAKTEEPAAETKKEEPKSETPKTEEKTESK